MSTRPVENAFKMLPQERRAAMWLSSIYALRMFGMFMILPVFAIHAAHLPGGNNPQWIGLAMGAYGLSQACMQIPLGWASDRWGRKPLIIVGLILFALGCILGFWATTVPQLALARTLQGAGAISAALSAFLADVTRDEVRSKGMAMIGSTIGVTFAASLVCSPVLYQWLGLNGLFGLTAFFSALAIAVVLWALPPEQAIRAQFNSENGPHTLSNQGLWTSDLLRLNVGIFCLHLTQMALFLVLPTVLMHQLGWPVNQHWKVYLPVMVLSFVIMVPCMVWAERKAKARQVKLGAIALMALVLLGLIMFSSVPWAVVGLLLAYFVGFNLLEAILPSWVSRVVSPSQRGVALGVYNTCQALGVFAGGALGGWALHAFGPQGVFDVVFVLLLGWLCAALGIRALPPRALATTGEVSPTV